MRRTLANLMCRVGWHQLQPYTYQGRLLDAFCFRSDYCRGRSHKRRFMEKTGLGYYTRGKSE